MSSRQPESKAAPDAHKPREPQIAADERRAKLRELCRPAYEVPRPRCITILGAALTGISLLAAAAFLALLFYSFALLLKQRPLAGEKMFGAGVGLLLALFLARVWVGFLRLADWRVAPEVPFRVKFLGAAGSALAASAAGAAVAVLLFAICSKEMFLGLLDRIGAADVGKVQFLFTDLALFSFFLVLWYVFQGLMELRAWARGALAMVLTAGMALAVGGVAADAAELGERLGNHGVAVTCWGIIGICVIGLSWAGLGAGGRAAARCFEVYEM
jgi:hypothetical protein